MATNLKAKKKKGTYDNKLIIWISIGLAAFVALVVGIFAIVSYTTNYVAKVDGLKIYTYEYNYFLREAISESFVKPEGYDDMTEEEQEAAFDAFYTDEVKAECQATALENAGKFKAQYRLACEAGFKLTSSEKAAMKSNADYYYNMYASSYGAEMALFYLTGGAMTLDEYKDYSIRKGTIEKYKNHLKEGYEVTTEEMKEIYDEDPNEYRTLTGRVFKFAIPTKPSVPTDEKGKEISADTTDETLKEEYLKYETALAEYNAKIEHFEELCTEIETAINAGGTFTLKDLDMVTYEVKKDDDGEEIILVKDGDFEALCAMSSWNSASSTKGVITVGAGNESGVEEIDEYLLQMQWNENRDGFVFVEDTEEEESEEDTEEDSASTSSETDDNVTVEQEKTITPSTLKRIEIRNEDGTLTALYLVRVEDIDDFDTEVEESDDTADATEDEETLNTVQSGIKDTILEDKAVAELDAKVEAAGSRFTVKSKKQERMDSILKEILE